MKTKFKTFTHMGCLVKVRVYNPNLGKLDSRTTCGYFIGYVFTSKMYRFYCPFHTLKVIEARNATFLEDYGISGSGTPHKWNLKI